nr:RNA-directed DNA polymerase, eukaryota [Tanacetum cinerariifolium]
MARFGLRLSARFMGLRLRTMFQSAPHAGALFFERFWRDTWLVDSPLCTRFPRIQVRDGAESQQWADLLPLLGTFSLSPSIDRWVCDLNGDGLFRVKDFRSVLDDLILPSSNMSTRWVKCVPVKVNVFAWRARLERLPTRDNLAKIGVHTDSNLCP